METTPLGSEKMSFEKCRHTPPHSNTHANDDVTHRKSSVDNRRIQSNNRRRRRSSMTNGGSLRSRIQLGLPDLQPSIRRAP